MESAYRNFEGVHDITAAFEQLRQARLLLAPTFGPGAGKHGPSGIDGGGLAVAPSGPGARFDACSGADHVPGPKGARRCAPGFSWHTPSTACCSLWRAS